jgi:hypothetical protein
MILSLGMLQELRIVLLEVNNHQGDVIRTPLLYSFVRDPLGYFSKGKAFFLHANDCLNHQILRVQFENAIRCKDQELVRRQQLQGTYLGLGDDVVLVLQISNSPAYCQHPLYPHSITDLGQGTPFLNDPLVFIYSVGDLFAGQLEHLVVPD